MYYLVKEYNGPWRRRRLREATVVTSRIRRVLKLGRSTLAVTLPKDWVDTLRLTQGDYLIVDETDGGALKLVPRKEEVEAEPSVCVINAGLCEAPNMLSRMVIGAYLGGHKIIWIQSRTRFKPEHVLELEKITVSLVGLHVSEQTDNLVVLQSLADPSKPTMDSSIRRLHLVSSFMREAVVKALIGGRAGDLLKVGEMGKEGDRVYWLAVRQLLTAIKDRKLAEALGIRSQSWLLGDRVVLSNLKAIINSTEAMAKETAKLLERCFRLEGDVISEISKFETAVADVSEGAVRALITRDVGLANQVIESIKGLEQEADRITDRLSEVIEAPLCRSSMLRVIFGLGEIVLRHKTIAEIAVNRALEESGDYVNIDVGFVAKA